jgi:hypothetical protein
MVIPEPRVAVEVTGRLQLGDDEISRGEEAVRNPVGRAHRGDDRRPFKRIE